jgi:hypothetical protein
MARTTADDEILVCLQSHFVGHEFFKEGERRKASTVPGGLLWTSGDLDDQELRAAKAALAERLRDEQEKRDLELQRLSKLERARAAAEAAAPRMVRAVRDFTLALGFNRSVKVQAGDQFLEGDPVIADHANEFVPVPDDPAEAA